MKKYVFPNGFTLIHQKPASDVPITSVYAFVRVGSNYEQESNRGATHFIEHMCFKGTTKLSTSKKIFENFNKVGATFNAFTEKDHTAFELRCGDSALEICLKHLSDMILNSAFKKSAVKMETPVTLEEMIRASDDPEEKIVYMMDKMLYTKSLYENPVDDIEFHKRNPPFQYDNIVEFYHQYYRPENIVLSIASITSFEKLKKILLSTDFLKSKGEGHIVHPALIPIQSTPNIYYDIQHKVGLKSTYLCISFRTCSHENPDRFRLNLLSHIVGGNMGSRMFMILREDNGLTYSSSCSTDYTLVGGEFTLYTSMDNSKLMRNGNKSGVLPLLFGMLRKLISNGIELNELKIAKESLKTKLMLNMERPTHEALYNGLYEILYSNEPFVEYGQIYDKQYSKITVSEINRVIRKYLIAENMCIGILSNRPPGLAPVRRICETI